MLLVASSAPLTADVNLILNVVMLVALAVSVPRIVQGKRKDAIIATDRQTIEALEARAKTLERERDAVERAADAEHVKRIEAEKAVEVERARYQEQSKYTAPEALADLKTIIVAQSDLDREILIQVRDGMYGLAQTLRDRLPLNGDR